MTINFFTIVLNGEPFIRYHINVFRQLTVPWHWHIVEGVAALNHDSAWSRRRGGCITDDLHADGRSTDGTTAYLDELVRDHGDSVTVYRKPLGSFWDGKREMVNAPLEHLREECLLWEVDVDECWTAAQIAEGHRLFLENPRRMAAYYWCWYFVGPKTVVSTRNCYSQNPDQEWLRTWRFVPGMRWASHAPPRLIRQATTDVAQHVGREDPFLHEETAARGLVFQHFAYVLERQVRFKETYYGYHNACRLWRVLQRVPTLPVQLRDYFHWVDDATGVDHVDAIGLTPLIAVAGFAAAETRQPSAQTRQRILIDCVYFQFHDTGIGRLWTALLQAWARTDFARELLVLDRDWTAPRIEGLAYRVLPRYAYDAAEQDRDLLQRVCDEEQARLFTSTYYTTTRTAPSVFFAYDMIPENIDGFDLSWPVWREKHYAIGEAAHYLAISHSTADELCRFHPPAADRITVAHCGVDREVFYPATDAEQVQFAARYGIAKPFFLLVGLRGRYKNAEAFFRGFARLPDQDRYEIICCGGSRRLESKSAALIRGTRCQVLQLTDAELRVAYSMALALVYPSKHEGFGLPLLEAMACGCPVITCRNSSLPEVAGTAALYVGEDAPEEMARALVQAQDPQIRNQLTTAGKEHVRRFTWPRTAAIVRTVLLATAAASGGAQPEGIQGRLEH